MRLTFLIRPALFLLAAVPASKPAAAQQQNVFFDPLLNMTAESIACQPGFTCLGTIVRNPASLDPQMVFSSVRKDGQVGITKQANLWTIWPNSAQVANSGAYIAPSMPATELVQKILLPERVMHIFPGAQVISVEHKQNCVAMKDRTDCAIAILNFKSREGHDMEALIDVLCRYEHPGNNIQFTDTTFLISFAPRGQLQALNPQIPQMQVNPQWHQREQARAQQFAREYQAQLAAGNAAIIANGAAQVAAIHRYGDAVLASDRATQHSIDNSARDFSDYVGDKVTVHAWRNTASGSITHTDSSRPPGPGWVEIQQ